jgi:hypothetical protein
VNGIRLVPASLFNITENITAPAGEKSTELIGLCIISHHHNQMPDTENLQTTEACFLIPENNAV